MEHGKTLIRIATLTLLCAQPLAAVAAEAPADPLTVCYETNQVMADVRSCLQRTLHQADADLAAAEQKRKKELDDLDDAAAKMRRDAQIPVHDAFERYRTALCHANGAMLEPGTGAGAVETACQISVTRWHIQMLKD